MAGSVNKVILLGNLGKDPEVRTTQAGSKIVNLSVATSEHWTDKQSGERKEKTEWHRVVIFNPNLADIAERYLRKGNKIYLEGSLQTRKWTDQQGQEKFSTEVVLTQFRGELCLLERNDDQGGGAGPRPSQNSNNQGGGYNRPQGGGQGGNQGGGYTRPQGGSGSAQGGGGPQWSAPRGGGDLDDEIPFACCWQ